MKGETLQKATIVRSFFFFAQEIIFLSVSLSLENINFFINNLCMVNFIFLYVVVVVTFCVYYHFVFHCFTKGAINNNDNRVRQAKLSRLGFDLLDTVTSENYDTTWCSSRRLQLNSNKTEVIWFGLKHNLMKLQNEDIALKIELVVINPSNSVHDLGVLLDNELTMRPHIHKISSACFYHLWRLRQPCRLIDRDMMQRLVSAFVISRLDYCNFTLAGLPACALEPLQRVLHAAVRLVAGLGPRDHIRESMKDIHSLPIAHCIKFKLFTLKQEQFLVRSVLHQRSSRSSF